MRAGTILSLFLILAVGLYAFLRAQSFIFGPTLKVQFPKPYDTVPHAFTLRGSTKNNTHLSINDQRTYPDEKGFFEKDLVLPAGYTIVKLYAHNRQKREQIIYLPLYIQPYDTNETSSIQKNSSKEENKSDES